MAAPTRRRTPGPRRIGDVWTVLRRARPPARHRHRHRPRVTRHQAGALDRRQHPRRRAHRHGRRVSRPPTSRRRLRRRRRTGHPRPAHPHLLRRAACQPRRRRVGARRPPRFRRVERASLAVPRTPTGGPVCRSRTSTATAGSCRCASPTRRARGCRIPTSRACWSPSRPTERSQPARPATGCSARARSTTTTGSPSRRPRPPEGLDMNRNFPAGWGTNVARIGRPPAVASRRSTRSCGPSSPGRTSAATTRSTPAAACCCGRRRSPADSTLPPDGRLGLSSQLGERGTRADRLHRRTPCSRTSRGTPRRR